MNIVASLIAELLSIAVASRLMRTSPWIPCVMGLGLFIAGGICVTFLPETLKQATGPESAISKSDGDISITSFLKSRLSQSTRELAESAAVLHCYPVVALLITFLLTGFVARALSFGAQYLSKSLGWSLADAGMLMSLQVVMNIVLYVAILPGCSRLLQSPSMPFKLEPVTRDFFLARMSFVFLFIGSFLLAWPSSKTVVLGLVVFTCGLGFSTLCRVVITSMIEPRQTGRLYTLISVLDSGSRLAAGPVLAWLFKTGLDLGDAWVGLPYLGVAFLCFLAMGLAFSVQHNDLLTHRHDDATQILDSPEDTA